MAFDFVPHAHLIAKMKTYGISINTCELMCKYKNDRSQGIRVNRTNETNTFGCHY